MYKLIVSILICTFLSASCKKDDNRMDARSYEYFSSNLTAGMSFTQIKLTFGEPDFDKGSGIHIYVYKLRDNTEVWIGYNDHIVYARHLDSNQQLLHTIV
jgi:hypothetical protein